MGISSILPSRRCMLFSILILALVANFFGGYYFYYVPFNKQGVRKQAFYILANSSKIANEKIPIQKSCWETLQNNNNRTGKARMF